MSDYGNFITGEPVVDDNLYTDEVTKLILDTKVVLPEDYTIKTRTDGPYIFIQVPLSNFSWRTVEDRLDIAIKLEKLKTLIRETGVNCEIETVEN